MQKLSTSRILLGLILVVSYSVTIPVLSVIHTHEMASSDKAVSSAQQLASKSHPLICEICFKINSSQTIIEQPTSQFAIQPKYKVISKNTQQHLPTPLLSLSHNRAPPIIYT